MDIEPDSKRKIEISDDRYEPFHLLIFLFVSHFYTKLINKIKRKDIDF